MLADAAQVGTAAAMDWLAVKKCGAGNLCTGVGSPNFFHVRPPCSKIDRESEHKKTTFDSETFNLAMIFHFDTLAHAIAISATRYGVCSPRNHALWRVHCFNSNEVRVVTFAPRRENDSLC
jgi:hypothetical protein